MASVAGAGAGSAGGRAAIAQLKKALRATAKSRVSAMSDGERQAASVSIAAQLARREDYAKAGRVAVFLSMAGEVDTEPILANLFIAGKKCFVPRFVLTTFVV
jgi:5-formyltetrahydrofolate cyclo-ligase